MPVRFNAMRNPLARPQTLTEAGSPGSSRFRNVKSLVADSPSTSTFTTPTPRKTLRQTAPRAFANPRSNASRMTQRNAPMQKPAGPKGKLGQAQWHRRVVHYLRKRVSCATISVTHSGKSSGRLAQRERRCLTSTRSQVQILYRPPLKSQVRRYSRLTFSFSGKSRASKRPTNSRQSATQAFHQYAVPIKMYADLRRRPKTSALSH